MALVISDRIKETTNTVGTQTYQLEGAVTGFETFASNLSNGDTTYYAVTDNTNFEVGLGTINEGTSQTINYTVTVANVGGINVFVLNGVNNPVITFVNGKIWRGIVSGLLVDGKTAMLVEIIADANIR